MFPNHVHFAFHCAGKSSSLTNWRKKPIKSGRASPARILTKRAWRQYKTCHGFTSSSPFATSLADALFEPATQNIASKPQGSSNRVWPSWITSAIFFCSSTRRFANSWVAMPAGS